MGVFSVLGRVLFATVFVLSAWQIFNEFGEDGGPSSKVYKPKIKMLTDHVETNLAFKVPDFEIKYLVAAAIVLQGLGSLLFVLGSSIGAYLLLAYLVFSTPLLHDFYNYDIEHAEFIPTFIQFVQNLALAGALLFFLGMKNSIPKKHQPHHKKKHHNKPKTT